MILFSFFCFFILIIVNYISCSKVGLTNNKYRYEALDGLRGICAAMVVVHHLFWRHGSGDQFWSLEYLDKYEKLFAVFIGQFPVAMFFILSGFLFYGVLEKKTIVGFISSRIIRIYPSVIFSLAMLSVSYVITYGPHLKCVGFIFSNTPTPINLNYTNTSCLVGMTQLNSGVLWTLIWELRLYCVIPVLIILKRLLKNDACVIGLSVLCLILQVDLLSTDQKNTSLELLFICGFLCSAIMKHGIKKNLNLPFAIFGIFSMIVSLSVEKKVFSPAVSISLIPIFLSIANGFSFKGILSSSSVRFLGLTSFTIYLNHGVFQYTAKHFLSNYIVWGLVSTTAISVVAPIIYKYIESLNFKVDSKPTTKKSVSVG